MSPTSSSDGGLVSDVTSQGIKGRRHAYLVEPGIYVISVLLFLAVPPLNRLHVESMALLATLSWFVSGRAFYTYRTEPIGRVLVGRIAWLIVPVGLLLLFSIWIPNCDWLRGLVFVPLFPVITVILSVSVAYCLDAFFTLRASRGLFWHTVIGTAILVLGPLFDVGLHPQFYSYNHIYGGVLGPIYDEEIVLRYGVISFRVLTLMWAVFAWLIGRIRREKYDDYEQYYALLTLFVIGLVYINSGILGINTTYDYLRNNLNNIRNTAHFEFYYKSGLLSEEEIRNTVIDAEYNRQKSLDYIGINSTSKVQVYIYSSPEERAALTGARYTSVSPVWLSEPQIHILKYQKEVVLAHELVHALSRKIGLPFVHASPLVGLVEGLAVAGQPRNGQPSIDDLVIASGFLEDHPADKLSTALSWWGFWGGRSAVSYTVTGSFVRFLISRYGNERFKVLYRSGAFVSTYGKTARVLADEWVAHLRSYSYVSLAARNIAVRGFSFPSLFERICPHWVPMPIRTYRSILSLMDHDRLDSALTEVIDLRQEHPEFSASRPVECRLLLAKGRPEAALRLFRDAPIRTAGEAVCLADTYVLTGKMSNAAINYDWARTLYPISSRGARAALTIRSEAALSPGGATMLRSLLPLILQGSAGSVRSSRLTRMTRLTRLHLLRDSISTQRTRESRLWSSDDTRSARVATSDPGSLVSYYLARTLSDDGAYEKAASIVDSLISGRVFSPETTAIRESRRYLELTAARWHYRAGARSAADRHASIAYDAYLSAGDMDAVRLVDELRQQIEVSGTDAFQKTIMSQ